MASDHSKLMVQSSFLEPEDSATIENTDLEEPLTRLSNLEDSNALRPDTLIDGNEKTIGTVLEEFKNKALLSLQRTQIQLVGPIVPAFSYVHFCFIRYPVICLNVFKTKLLRESL